MDNPDFALVAKAMGMEGFTVNESGERAGRAGTGDEY